MGGGAGGGAVMQQHPCNYEEKPCGVITLVHKPFAKYGKTLIGWWKFIKFHWWLRRHLSLRSQTGRAAIIASLLSVSSDDPSFNGCLQGLLPVKVATNYLHK